MEFGGHPIFAHVHQYLVPPRALRVLVWDSSAGSAGIAVLRRHLCGWASSRAAFSLRNILDTPPPALLVVATRADAFDVDDSNFDNSEINEFAGVHDAVTAIGFGVDFDVVFDAESSKDACGDAEAINVDDSDEDGVEEGA